MEKEMFFETHYIKSNDFRTVPASGFYGGVTPNGKLHFTHFVERFPIPKKAKMSVEVDEFGRMLSAPIEIEKDTLDGVVRECHGALMMDIEVAESLVSWLEKTISEYKKSIKNK